MDDDALRLDLEEHDTPAEVDAAFRTLRRVAVWHFVLFGVVVLGVPALSLTLGWWSAARIDGGMSPGFAMAAFGLYAFFAGVGLAAATLSSAVEARMLGGSHGDDGVVRSAYDDARGMPPSVVQAGYDDADGPAPAGIPRPASRPEATPRPEAAPQPESSPRTGETPARPGHEDPA